jgi:type II secretion system protein C
MGAPGLGDTPPPARRKRTPGLWGIGLVEAAYIIVAGILFARLLFTLLTPLPIPAPGVQQAATGPQADLSVFGRFDPFVGTAPTTVEAPPVRLEETRLNLKLVGTFVDGTKTATIQTGSGQRVFALGEAIAAGVTIEEIHADHIILRRNGMTESLSFENRERRPVRAQTPQVAPASETALPAGLQDFVRIEPAPGGDGYILYAGRRPQFFEAAGLLNGDRLLAINNRAVGEDFEFDQLAGAIGGGGVQLTVERQGVPISIRLDPAGLSQ